MKLYDLLQMVVIALCVAGSCAYMVRTYAPGLWARGIGALRRVLPASLRRRLEARASARSTSGASACDRCGACPPAARRR